MVPRQGWRGTHPEFNGSSSTAFQTSEGHLPFRIVAGLVLALSFSRPAVFMQTGLSSILSPRKCYEIKTQFSEADVASRAGCRRGSLAFGKGIGAATERIDRQAGDRHAADRHAWGRRTDCSLLPLRRPGNARRVFQYLADSRLALLRAQSHA